MQNREEIKNQADLCYLHARYGLIDMITNAGVVDCHGTCLSDLPCQNPHATTNENRDLYSDIVADKLGGCDCGLFTEYYKYSFVCPDPGRACLEIPRGDDGDYDFPLVVGS